ncbi:MAG: hypothetical protein IKN30_04000 [Synergistaceae bacterium]|nr:hypothetical protein [Synergistaceae bacterium]
MKKLIKLFWEFLEWEATTASCALESGIECFMIIIKHYCFTSLKFLMNELLHE